MFLLLSIGLEFLGLQVFENTYVLFWFLCFDFHRQTFLRSVLALEFAISICTLDDVIAPACLL